MTTQEIINRSPAIKSTTIAFSENFILTIGGVLNIYNDLTAKDCTAIQTTNKLKQIQFARAFNVSDITFGLINSFLLSGHNSPTLRLTLNGHNAVNDLNCLSELPHLRSLTVNMLRNNQLDKINQFTKLTSLGLGGSISIKPIVEHKSLEELFLFEKLKDIEVIASMTNLKKISFSRMTLKNLDFLVDLHDLKELHFMLGSATDYSKLPYIGKIEKLSFTLVRRLTVESLLPINNMNFIKELKFDAQAHLSDLNWLTKKNINTEVINCKNFRR